MHRRGMRGGGGTQSLRYHSLGLPLSELDRYPVYHTRAAVHDAIVWFESWMFTQFDALTIGSDTFVEAVHHAVNEFLEEVD